MPQYYDPLFTQDTDCRVYCGPIDSATTLKLLLAGLPLDTLLYITGPIPVGHSAVIDTDLRWKYPMHRTRLPRFFQIDLDTDVDATLLFAGYTITWKLRLPALRCRYVPGAFAVELVPHTTLPAITYEHLACCCLGALDTVIARTLLRCYRTLVPTIAIVPMPI